MTILQKKTKRSGYKLLGASLPPWFHNYVSLYSMAKEITKSEIITVPLEKWITESYKKEPIDILICAIISNINKKWKVKYHGDFTKSNFDKFKKDVELELNSKGINKEYVIMILKGVKWKEQGK